VQLGSIVSVYCPAEATRLQPGFFHAFGETILSEDPRDGLRFYWNVSLEGAEALLRSLVPVLNRFQVPFRLKCPVYASMYSRRDTVVLYVATRWQQVTAQLISLMYEQLAEHVRDDVPLFTYRLHPGVALAGEPGNGESFGMHRCRLVAEGILEAHEHGRKSAADRLAAVRTRFALDGLALDRPHHGPDQMGLAEVLA